LFDNRLAMRQDAPLCLAALFSPKIIGVSTGY
jgi:hypothetical protein